MSATIHQLRPHTEAERRVIQLAERADMAERAKMMVALAESIALLKQIARETRKP